MNKYLTMDTQNQNQKTQESTSNKSKKIDKQLEKNVKKHSLNLYKLQKNV